MKTPIIFDCDGVLLDWEAAFRVWMRQKGIVYSFPTERPQDWELSHWTGLSKTETMFWVRQFNQSEAFRNIKAMPEALNVVCILRQKGHPLFSITSCDRQATLSRATNIRRAFNDWIFEPICLDLGESKQEELQRFHDAFGPCIWVEDNYENARIGQWIGHKSFLIRRPHNANHHQQVDDGIIRLDCISELLSHIS